MAAKQERRDLGNRLASIFKARSFRYDDEHNEEKSLKQKVSKPFSKVIQFFAKSSLSEPSSPSLTGLSPELNNHEMTPRTSELFSKYDDTCSSPKISELSSERKEADKQAAGKSCSNIALSSTGIDEHSSGIGKLSPKGQESFPKADELCYEERRSDETFMFPSASKEQLEVEQEGEESKPRGAFHDKEKQQQHVVSEPCINKYSKLIASRGIHLTEAAYELNEEQSRLLYEDIFKPLDLFSMLRERSKTVPQENYKKKAARTNL